MLNENVNVIILNVSNISDVIRPFFNPLLYALSSNLLPMFRLVISRYVPNSINDSN